LTAIHKQKQTAGRDCANADGQETVRRLEDQNKKPSVLVEEYEKKIVQLKEEMEHTLRDQTSNIRLVRKRYEEENQRQVLKMRDTRNELLLYKEQLPGIRTPTGLNG
jgi:hypothetical protein